MGGVPRFLAERGGVAPPAHGAVAPDDLRQVLTGISPQGEILTAGWVDEDRLVTGFDLALSAPESVSLLFGLSRAAVSATVRGVHEDATDQALDYLRLHALGVRRGAGAQISVGAERPMAAAFTHPTSRACDPQLHTHVLEANVAKGVDGVWSAPDTRLIFGHTRTAGFLYEAALQAWPHQSPRCPLRTGGIRHTTLEMLGIERSLLDAASRLRHDGRGIVDRASLVSPFRPYSPSRRLTRRRPSATSPPSERVTRRTAITPIVINYAGYPALVVKSDHLPKGLSGTVDITKDTVTKSGTPRLRRGQ